MLTLGSHDADAAAILAPGRSHLVYGELNNLVGRIGSQLRVAGISRDDRVALLAPNGPEAATAFLAIASACQCAPLNPAYRDAELDYYLQDLRPRLIIHATERPPEVAAPLGIPTTHLRVDASAPAGMFSLPHLPRANGALLDAATTALLLHTSGTTSRPKLVPLTWDNLDQSARNISSNLHLTAADRCLNVLPLFHISGLVTSLLATLHTGGSVVCAPGLIVPSFFDWLDEFAPTWYSAVPTMHQSILARAPRHPDSLRRSRLRFTRSASSALPIAVAGQLESTFRAPVVNTYGLTETAGQLSTTGLTPAVRKPGSVGRAVGAEIAVMDARGERVPVNVDGHICARGANVMSGYVDNDAANQESFHNGWFDTGDLGRIDGDGDLFVTGRVKEIINRGGEKISGQEVDEVLLTHPAVQHCLTFALPDSVFGEELGVVVVRRAGAAVEESELQTFAARWLADFKVPRRVFFRNDIPRSATGKLQRLGLAGRLGLTIDAWKPVPDAPAPVAADLTDAVIRIVAGVLGVRKVNPHVRFFDAGGDSVLAAQLLSRLESEFGKTLTMVDLFRSSSPSGIAATLAAAPATIAVLPSPAPADDRPKLSVGQVGLWLHDRFDDESLAAHTIRLFEIRGTADHHDIRKALLRIIERHDPLRTVIDSDGGEPRARLRAIEPFTVPVYDWTATAPERRESSARELCLRDSMRPFKLDSDLMLRASLHNLGDGRWWLLVLTHHIATDGWSAQLVRHELQTALEGRELPALSASYYDFVKWQESELSADRRATLAKYWTSQLAGVPTLLDLPLEFPRPTRQAHRGRAVTSVMPRSLRSRLLAASHERGATLFMTLLAGWVCLLSRYTGSTDICVGSPHAGRHKPEFENLVGLFMNLLVLRTRLDGDPTFTEALDRVRETSLGAWAHDLPLDYLLEALPPGRNLNHSPYYQVHFQLRNYPLATASATVPVTEVDLEFQAATTDLNVEITDCAEGLSCRLIYNTAVFSERFARAMLGHFEVLLRGAVEAPATRLSRLPITTSEEIETLVRRLPPQLPSAQATVVQMFERQAAERRDDVAIRFRDRRLTYGELNQQSNRLASVLIAAGVVPDQVVALCIERSPEWIVAMLAVAKAGGAYMALDPHHPPALIRDLMTRSRAAILLADDACRESLGDAGVPVIWTGTWPGLLANRNTANPPLAASPHHLAHVFFTSGSTGRPKGVATEHRNLSAYLMAYHWMPYSPSETYLQFTSLTFDPAAAEVWGPLTHGGCCAVYAEGLDDPSQLAQWIRDTGVTTCYLSASVFNTLVDEAPEVLRPVKRILVGGEALSVPHVRRALELLPRTELINGYGPTETTVYYTGYPIPRPFDPARTSVPIGRPLDGGCAYVMDQSGQLLPDGLPGELWIGGDTVARGYLHEPELTAAAFVADPITGRADARLYRTGDRARWLPDGQLEFLGRTDHQIKVRGMRIELGEIEAVLREHPAVRHAIVVATAHPVAGNILTAFVERQDGADATALELRAFLAGRLAHQMVPARMQLRALPMTASGKIDRRALNESAALEQDSDAAPPAPGPAVMTQPAAASSPDLQHKLAEIWKDLLGIQYVTAGDDFFALGGHSLLAVRLAFQIERQFGQRVTLVSLFEAATLSRMAALIRDPRPAVHAVGATSDVSPVAPMLCVGAGPLFRPFAEAMSPMCQFHSVPTPAGSKVTSMEELAARILPAIQESHRRGPVIVAGWSLAGVVAIELAAQLERAGTDVRAVVLFDTLSPVRYREWFAPSPRLRQWQLNLVKVRYHLEEARARGVAGAWPYLATTARDARARIHYDRVLRETAAGGNGPFDVPLDFRNAFGFQAARYTPSPLNARLVVVRPERQKRISLLAGDLGWAELGYKVEMILVPGDHERMFAPANARVLAERLLKALAV